MHPRNPKQKAPLEALDLASSLERQSFVVNKRSALMAKELCQNIIRLYNLKGNYLKLYGQLDEAIACFAKSAEYRAQAPSPALLAKYERQFKELNEWFLREHQKLTASKFKNEAKRKI